MSSVMESGDRVTFADFGGGNPRPLEGTFVSMDTDYVTVAHEGKDYRFRRAPGPKSGWGVGPSAKWRLGLDERAKLCVPDTVRGRRP